MCQKRRGRLRLRRLAARRARASTIYRIALAMFGTVIAYILIAHISFWLPPIHVGSSAPSDVFLASACEHGALATLSSYPGSTASAASIPRGWYVNRCTQRVGVGPIAYKRAKCALHQLEPFRLGWLVHCGRGENMVLASRQCGIWLVNANRILHQDDASITFGTTTRHVLAGEERLAIHYAACSGEVTFEVLSFSRPRHLLSWLAYPIVLMQQRRFARDASVRMRSCCENPRSQTYDHHDESRF